MSDLDALLAGIVAHPHEHIRWLIVADWLDDHGFADRAELLRLHRMLIDTCCEPDAHPERAAWQARIVELIDAGVKPCVPQHTLTLPSGVPLVGNFIPPGSFLMGGTEFDEEKPVHRVTLTRGFFTGVGPVTQVQWQAMMGENPSHFNGDDDLPVEQVSWEDAAAFCDRTSAATRASVRLPSEAEWEWACRAGTTTHFHWGNVPDANRMNYDGTLTWNGSKEGTNRKTAMAAGTFGANPWGLFDLHGNVMEWCADWFDEGFYSRSPAVEPVCEDGEQTRRVLRGGSWWTSPRLCRAACRNRFEPVLRGHTFGFRVAFTLG
jgi:uncharacterized protein (TIGR02996 family)